jgi:hypothetical protein
MNRSTLRTKLTRRLAFEPLEDRRMLAVFTVQSLTDAALRQAIASANSQPGADIIRFNTGLSGTLDLSVLGDTTSGPSALVVTSDITIQGNAAGITIRRAPAGPEMRLFRVSSTGSLTLESVALAGGIVRGGNDADGRGGAVYNEGTLRISASTLHDHLAIGGNAATESYGRAGLGGAVYSDGGVVVLENATLSGNTVQSGTGSLVLPSLGAGVWARHGNLSIFNSTITNSTATTARGVYTVNTGGTLFVEVYSSIIGQVDVSNFITEFIVDSGPGEDTTVLGGNNIIRRQIQYHEITVSTDDPLLGALANNGGLTRTHAIQANSPAVQAGANPRALATDQRGPSFARVVGGQADIGAFELQTVVGPLLPGDYNSNGTVNAGDYLFWRRTYGAQVTPFAGADGSGNGVVDAADYAVWLANFGTTGSGAATAAESTVPALSTSLAAADAPPRIEQGAAAMIAFDSLAALRPASQPTRAQPRAPLPDQAYDQALLVVLAEREEYSATSRSARTNREGEAPAELNGAIVFDSAEDSPSHSSDRWPTSRATFA